jgi:hypothetical protein
MKKLYSILMLFAFVFAFPTAAGSALALEDGNSHFESLNDRIGNMQIDDQLAVDEIFIMTKQAFDVDLIAIDLSIRDFSLRDTFAEQMPSMSNANTNKEFRSIKPIPILKPFDRLRMTLKVINKRRDHVKATIVSKYRRSYSLCLVMLTGNNFT